MPITRRKYTYTRRRDKTTILRAGDRRSFPRNRAQGQKPVVYTIYHTPMYIVFIGFARTYSKTHVVRYYVRAQVTQLEETTSC